MFRIVYRLDAILLSPMRLLKPLFLFLILLPKDGFGFGYLTVRTLPSGMEVFLDNKSIGRAPIEMMKLDIGNYTVSLYPSDSLEASYWRAREKGLFAIIKRVPDFARFHTASVRITILDGQETEVFLSYPATLKAKRNASWILWGGAGCLFTTGILLGIILTLPFR